MAEIFGQRIQTAVNTEYLPYVVDTVLDSNVLFQRMVRGAKNGKKRLHGRTLRFPIKVSKNSTGQSFRGFDQFSVEATDNRQFLEFTQSNYQITCALPMDELAIARSSKDSEEAILDLMAVTMESDAQDMADDLGTLFYGDGTGNGSKDPLGLAAHVDDGSSVATYGGLSRSTFDTIQSTVTASGGTLTLAKMDTLYAAVKSGSIKPSVILTTEAIYNFYGQLLRPQERITKPAGMSKGLRGGTGFDALEYSGKPVIDDEKCTAQTMFMLNEKYLDWYALPFDGEAVKYKSAIKGNDYGSPLGLGFSWSGWIKPTNAAAVVGHIYFSGQFCGNNPKRQGKLTGITGV